MEGEMDIEVVNVPNGASAREMTPTVIQPMMPKDNWDVRDTRLGQAEKTNEQRSGKAEQQKRNK